MTTGRDDLSAACKALLRRKRWKDAERTTRLEVYSKSLVQRFKAIQYAYGEIRGMTGSVIGLATGTTQSIPDPAERLGFYANGFWAFAYSLFDILANVINVVHPMSVDESKVSFVQAVKDYKDLTAKYRSTRKQLPAPLVNRLQAVIRSGTFQRLEKYRQCCLHRREVCLGQGTTPQIVSSPYVGTTAINEPETVLLICDDPQAMRPQFSRQRQLLDECEAVGKFVKNELISILGIL